MLAYRALTNRIAGLAIALHCTIGPDLLASVHAACLKDGLRRFVV
ncbi:hypothetical protein [Rhodopila globiformis]|nr:hypothetical protein [Rhodopila globiformis]